MAQFVNEAFKDTSFTALSSHPSVGATAPYASSWTRLGSGSADCDIESNTLVNGSTDNSNKCVYKCAGTPANANYSVSAHIKKNAATGKGYMGVVARCTDVNNLYFAFYDAYDVAWLLFKRVSGTDTQIGAYSTSLSTGTTYLCKLTCNGTTISVDIDGTNRISVTDSALSSAGQAGIMAYLAVGDTNDLIMIDLSADDVGATQYNKTLSVGNTGVASVALVKNFAPSVSVTLCASPTDATVQANLTGLEWAWFDNDHPSALVAPTDTGTGATTNGSGVMIITMPHSVKTSGQFGLLVVSSGTTDVNVAMARVAVT